MSVAMVLFTIGGSIATFCWTFYLAIGGKLAPAGDAVMFLCAYDIDMLKLSPGAVFDTL